MDYYGYRPQGGSLGSLFRGGFRSNPESWEPPFQRKDACSLSREQEGLVFEVELAGARKWNIVWAGGGDGLAGTAASREPLEYFQRMPEGAVRAYFRGDDVTDTVAREASRFDGKTDRLPSLLPRNAGAARQRARFNIAMRTEGGRVVGAGEMIGEVRRYCGEAWACSEHDCRVYGLCKTRRQGRPWVDETDLSAAYSAITGVKFV